MTWIYEINKEIYFQIFMVFSCRFPWVNKYWRGYPCLQNVMEIVIVLQKIKYHNQMKLRALLIKKVWVNLEKIKNLMVIGGRDKFEPRKHAFVWMELVFVVSLDSDIHQVECLDFTEFCLGDDNFGLKWVYIEVIMDFIVNLRRICWVSYTSPLWSGPKSTNIFYPCFIECLSPQFWRGC